jgi:hypothetical protein
LRSSVADDKLKQKGGPFNRAAFFLLDGDYFVDADAKGRAIIAATRD